MFRYEKFPKVRKHTLSFLKYSKHLSPITLSSEIDMTQINVYKNNSSHKLSYITFLTYIISRVLMKNDQGHLAFQSGISPKLIRYQDINAKVTFNKMIENHHTVVSGILEKTNLLNLNEIQDKIDFYKFNPVQTYPTYRGLRVLHSLPQILSNYVFKKIMNDPQKKHALQGSFAITSLGHQPIDTFIPLSGNTLTFGVGQVKSRAVVCENKIQVRPTLILFMIVDHRVLDGFLSAKILAEIKHELENFNL